MTYTTWCIRCEIMMDTERIEDRPMCDRCREEVSRRFGSRDDYGPQDDGDGPPPPWDVVHPDE